MQLLHDYWYQDDRRVEMALESLREGLETRVSANEAHQERSARKLTQRTLSWVIQDYGDRVAKVRQAQKSFADDKERSFEAKVGICLRFTDLAKSADTLSGIQMVDDQIRLLVLQQQLEQEAAAAGRPFVGLSLNETIRQCLLAGLDKRADKARSDFKVPDKRCASRTNTMAFRSFTDLVPFRSFWYLKIRALIVLRDWNALDAFARSKKSPIGYEPWVDELIRAGAHRQAVRYVEKCDPRNRVELYVKCGEWVMAGQECARRGERGRLQ